LPLTHFQICESWKYSAKATIADADATTANMAALIFNARRKIRTPAFAGSQTTGQRMSRIFVLAAASVVGWRQSGHSAEGRAERTRFAEPDREPNIGYGQVRPGKQRFGVFDAAFRVIPVRRNSEGFLERPAKITRAQPNKPSEGR
jgi:hypothetical protein